MNLYPAITFRMGDWDYYVVKMTARELADSVKFAYEIYEDRTLDDAIQRTLKDSRVRTEIVTYLTRQPARFFSSIVIAALRGDPKFYGVEVTDDEKFAIFRDDQRLNQTFGVLAFDGSQDYFALDGQHRLAAIRTLLDKADPLSEKAPAGFADDELSVIIVVPKVDETAESFMQRYRRLFSNLNRYAKPTDKTTNIIMDEDDAFAILTRRLITEHEFFRWEGRHKESKRVKTVGGKALREGDSYFTSLITLYEMNRRLLSARYREDEGWGIHNDTSKSFIQFRPDEELLETFYAELTLVWDALLKEIPDLSKPPSEMRVHSAEEEASDSGHVDHLLFWPIGQEMLAQLVRDLLDLRTPDPRCVGEHEASEALRGLGTLEWRLHRPPWRHFLLTSDPTAKSDAWKMRSEDRKETVEIGLMIQRWLIGIDELTEDEVEKLKLNWETRLIPAQKRPAMEEMWERTVERLELMP